MDRNSANVQEIVRRYRKPAIIAVLALVSVLVLGVVGAGYAVYKTASSAASRFTPLQPGATETVSELPAQASGFVEGVVLNVASAWLRQGAASSEVATVKNGLSCFDALGGPSPTEIVGYVQRTVTDTALVARLQDLTESLGGSGSTADGPAACASWLLNG